MTILPIVSFITAFAVGMSDCSHVPKIVGGFTCQAKDYPYLVSLATVTRSFYCGGSLINRFHVLTAGHCCDYTNVKEQIKVYTGISEKKDNVQTARAWKRIIHPELDVCILRLYTPIEETSHTKLAKLATTDMFNELAKNHHLEECITLGFGFQGRIHVDEEQENIPQTNKLQCVFQKVLPYCYDLDTLCAIGSHRPEQDACLGDSGSPLICQGIQVGFVMSGHGCGLGIPSYYMSVPRIYKYIEKISQGNVLRVGITRFISFLYCLNILFKAH